MGTSTLLTSCSRSSTVGRAAPGSDAKNCSCCRSSVRPCPSLWLTQQVGSLALLGKCPRSAFRAHRRIVFAPRLVHPGCPSLDEATLSAAVVFCTHSGRRVHMSLHVCLQNCMCVMLLGTFSQLLAVGGVYFEALHCSGRKSGCGDMEVPRHGALMWGTLSSGHPVSVCTPVCQVGWPADPEPRFTSHHVVCGLV